MFVERSEGGAVCGLYTVRQLHATEELPDDHAEVTAFRAARDVPAAKKPDIDDLVLLLQDKGIVTDQDLETIAHSKEEIVDMKAEQETDDRG